MTECPECRRSFESDRIAALHWGHLHEGPHPFDVEFTKDHRQAISDGLTGRSLPEEHRQRISESLKGREFSEDHRRRLGEASQTNSDEAVLEDIRSCAAELGRVPTREEFSEWVDYTAQRAEYRFGTWNDCLREAGLADRDRYEK